MYFFKMLFTLKITFFFSDDPNPTMYIPQKVESSAESIVTHKRTKLVFIKCTTIMGIIKAISVTANVSSTTSLK